MNLKLRDIRNVAALVVCTGLFYFSGHKKNKNEQKNHSDKLSGDDMFDQVIDKYLSARKNNMSIEDIAQKLFNIEFPNQSEHVKHSFPFLSNGTLEAFADWVYVKQMVPLVSLGWLGLNPLYAGKYKWRKRGNKKEMQNGDVIYLRSDHVEEFAQRIHPQIKVHYILLSHDSDISVPNGTFSTKFLQDSRLIRWFALNPAISHPKLEALPIGIMPRGHPDGSGEMDIWEELLNNRIVPYLPSHPHPVTDPSSSPRNLSLYVNLTPGNSRLRQRVYNKLVNMQTQQTQHKDPQKLSNVQNQDNGRNEPTTTLPLVHIVTQKRRRSSEEFLSDLTNSRFVISPPGIGEDCFRTWESVILGAIPVVFNSTNMAHLWLAAPVMAMNRLEDISPSALNDFTISSNTRRDVALASYWIERINSFRQN